MQERKSKTIEGVTFYVTPLGFKAQRRGFVRLSKAVGPSLAVMSSGTAPAPSEAEQEPAQAVEMGPAIRELVDRISDEDLEWFEQLFGPTTMFSVDDPEKTPILREPEREILFRGRLALYFQWLAFCLEVNYSDFLSWLKSAVSGGGRSETA